MYGFTDVIGNLYTKSLPAEAMNINGRWIENEIDGYTTLYVQGREAISTEVSEQDTGFRDGTLFQRSRLNARTITVGYQILSDSQEQFREYFNRLNEILSAKQAVIYFNDEPDKYFVGTKSDMDDPDGGRLNITGEFSILCTDPLKYARTEKVIECENPELIDIDYDGTYPTWPVITADVTAGMSGMTFADFTDGVESIVSIGNTTGKDTTEGAIKTFYELNIKEPSDWTFRDKQVFVNDDGSREEQTGSNANVVLIEDGYITRSAEEPQAAYAWDAVEMKKSIPVEQYGDGSYVLRFYPVLKYQTGGSALIQVILRKGGSDVLKVELKQSAHGNGSMEVYDGGDVITNQNFDLDGTEPVCISLATEGTGKIEAFGSTLALKDGTLAPDEIVVLLGKRNGRRLAKMGLAGLEYKTQTEAHSSEAALNYSDLVVADFTNGTISVNGTERPELGEVENAWEGFAMEPGRNMFEVSYPEALKHKPRITVRYREAYL